MKILVLNVATTGLNNAHIVQLNYIAYDIRANIINTIESHIFNPPIDDTNESFSGVSKMAAHASSAELTVELIKLFDHIGHVDLIIGHNVEFTINMILGAIGRDPDKFAPNIQVRLMAVSTYCTMRSSIMCNTLNSSVQKYPNIHELAQLLFANEPHQQYTNNAYKKLFMTLRCFCMKKYSFDINLVNDQFNAYYELIDDGDMMDHEQ